MKKVRVRVSVSVRVRVDPNSYLNPKSKSNSNYNPNPKPNPNLDPMKKLAETIVEWRVEKEILAWRSEPSTARLELGLGIWLGSRRRS
jgi:hypothetical protein